MSDLRIQYSEEMVGSGHPTKPDTLNRLALVETDQDGHGKLRYLKAQSAAPATAADEGALYTKAAGGRPELFFRGQDSGAEVRLSCADGPGSLLLPRAIAGLLPDDQLPADNDTSLGAVRLANAGGWAWGHFEAWLTGVAWRIRLEAVLSTGESAQVDLRLAYQVFGPDATMNPAKTRWQASHAYASGARVIPTTPNGHYYQCTTAGESGASEPAWPASGTVSDGAAVWTRQGAGFKNLALAVTPPGAAFDRFDVDSASLQVPASEVTLGDRVHFGLWRSASDTHGGDLIVNELWIAPVEA
ncbi:MAG: hypothetical protein V1797_08750 [Pseudomonadota bacterium]